MINTSKEYKEYIRNSRKFYIKATIVLSDGTELIVDDTENDNIMSGGMRFTDSTSDSGAFSIGSAIINSHTLILDNSRDQFSDYDFTDAIIYPKVGLQLSSTVEYLNKGVYTVDTASVIGTTIVLNALDNMNKFDTPFSDVNISFPCTAITLLQSVCTHCGVTLSTTTFLNSEYTIYARLDDEAITCREIVAWIAQLSGNFARFNVDGTLELKWYDFGVFEKESSIDGGVFDNTTEPYYKSGDDVDGGDFTFSETTNYDGGTILDMNRYHHLYDLYSSTINTNIVITGVQVTDTSEEPITTTFGSVGYILSIESNYLIQDSTQASIIANTVGAKIVGMKFSPMDISVLGDPCIEAGDVAYVSNFKNNSYQTLITNIDYTIGNSETITCDAETISKNNSTQYSVVTKAIIEARKNTAKQLSEYDIVAQQMNNLITNGFGLFNTTITDTNGGTIYYLHDKLNMSESTYRWFMTSNGMMEQKNINGTWTIVTGTDKEGNALYNVITARGINADWITIDNLVVGKNVAMGDNATISWSKVTNQPNIIDSNTVTTITNNAISTATISANQIIGGILKGVQIQQISSSGKISSSLYQNELGGLLNIYDSDNNLNVQLGVESGTGANVGGTLLLCNDDKNKIRVLLTTEKSTDSGVLQLYRSNNTMGTQLTPTSGCINGFDIITDETIGNQTVDLANRSTYAYSAGSANSANSAGYLTGVGSDVMLYSNTLRPSNDNSLMLGSPSYRWSTVYAESSTISTSDRLKKKNINHMTSKQLDFFMKLIPTVYQFIDGTSDRKHYGFISQDVEKAMDECNLTSLDFAGFVKSPQYDKKLENGEWDTSSNIIGYDYFLRYEEFIALVSYVVQQQQYKLNDLENRVLLLENK